MFRYTFPVLLFLLWLTGLICIRSDNPVGYVVRAGWYQGKLLAGRIPNERAIAEGYFDDEQVARLQLIDDIKTFGAEIGLSATENYSTINPTWDHTIWNLSACDPVAFRPETWWFPIVGTVPYLGYFERSLADEQAADMRERGLDVYVRTAGAYSTLGWFEDPVLPNMLTWSDHGLANTILHELAHATLWIPGSVQFNESFANFVGNVAAVRYLEARFGADSPELTDTLNRIEDRKRYTAFLRDVYQQLDAVYEDPNLDRDAKLQRKQTIFDQMPTAARAWGFNDPDRWVTYFEQGEWNNARLMQFHTYNRSPDQFQALLDAQGGDLLAFFSAVEAVTRDTDDPYAALATAVEAD